MNPTIIILKESFWTSIIRDAFTFLMLVSSIGVGVALGSNAMQWAGVFFFVLAVLSKASTSSVEMTIIEARAYLDDLENGGAA